MKTKIISVALAFAITALVGCAREENKDVPVNVVDQNQAISRDNAQMGAKRWAGDRLPAGYRVVAQSDSTIRKDCRYGDGWATVDVFDSSMRPAVDPEHPDQYLKLKCQTNGNGKGLYGCLTVAEFQTKDYKQEEGSCQNLPELPKFSSTQGGN